MTLPITIMMILSAVGLSTLFFIRKIFSPLEIIAYFMVITALIQQIYTMITFNLGMIQLTGKVSVFWFLNINLLIIVPCVTIWLLYSYFSPAVSPFLKALMTGGWLLGMFGIELLFHRFGFITFKRWHIGYSFIEWLIILIGSLCFILWFRNLLRKQASA
ncbi:MAG TPA: hypothetical protein VGE40_05900 [Bacilli bacterium]